MNKREELWLQKTYSLIAYDLSYSSGIIAGMDEAGRGPLAGDVVAAMVIMPKDKTLKRIDDSKKLSEKARFEIAQEINNIALFIGIGSASPEEIDKFNILQATKLAMTRAAKGLKPDVLLVDAVKGLGLPYPTYSIISGDALSYSIACASVIAKVTRDMSMIKIDKLYPQYCFAQNKAYGTKVHINALKEFGPCPIHRKSFIKNFERS